MSRLASLAEYIPPSRIPSLFRLPVRQQVFPLSPIPVKVNRLIANPGLYPRHSSKRESEQETPDSALLKFPFWKESNTSPLPHVYKRNASVYKELVEESQMTPDGNVHADKKRDNTWKELSELSSSISELTKHQRAALITPIIQDLLTLKSTPLSHLSLTTTQLTDHASSLISRIASLRHSPAIFGLVSLFMKAMVHLERTDLIFKLMIKMRAERWFSIDFWKKISKGFAKHVVLGLSHEGTLSVNFDHVKTLYKRIDATPPPLAWRLLLQEKLNMGTAEMDTVYSVLPYTKQPRDVLPPVTLLNKVLEYALLNRHVSQSESGGLKDMKIMQWISEKYTYELYPHLRPQGGLKLSKAVEKASHKANTLIILLSYVRNFDELYFINEHVSVWGLAGHPGVQVALFRAARLVHEATRLPSYEDLGVRGVPSAIDAGVLTTRPTLTTVLTDFLIMFERLGVRLGEDALNVLLRGFAKERSWSDIQRMYERHMRSTQVPLHRATKRELKRHIRASLHDDVKKPKEFMTFSSQVWGLDFGGDWMMLSKSLPDGLTPSRPLLKLIDF